jgi:hypothetical protein
MVECGAIDVLRVIGEMTLDGLGQVSIGLIRHGANPL